MKSSSCSCVQNWNCSNQVQQDYSQIIACKILHRKNLLKKSACVCMHGLVQEKIVVSFRLCLADPHLICCLYITSTNFYNFSQNVTELLNVKVNSGQLYMYLQSLEFYLIQFYIIFCQLYSIIDRGASITVVTV